SPRSARSPRAPRCRPAPSRRHWILGPLDRARTTMGTLMRVEDFVRDARVGVEAVDVKATRAVAQLLADAAERDARVFIVGNGGSADMASHFHNDLIKGAAA